MNVSRITKWLKRAAFTISLCAVPVVAAAGDCCICGTKICCPEVTVGSETHICWDVECEEICVPPIRFPWSDCCSLSCGGFVRTVHRLKAVEQSCPTVEYEWKSVCASCRAGISGHRPGASSGTCGCDACQARAEQRPADEAQSTAPVAPSPKTHVWTLPWKVMTAAWKSD